MLARGKTHIIDMNVISTAVKLTQYHRIFHILGEQAYLSFVIRKFSNSVQCPGCYINSKNMVFIATLYAVLREIYAQRISLAK